jgi:hypothetical protein
MNNSIKTCLLLILAFLFLLLLFDSLTYSPNEFLSDKTCSFLKQSDKYDKYDVNCKMSGYHGGKNE